MANLSIKKGDYVQVISGEDKGKGGEITSVNPTTGKIIVEGVNIVKKHKKARNAQDKAGIISKPAAIDASNVMIVCSSCGKATKVGYKFEDKDGKPVKVRVCKKCGASLEVKRASTKAKAATKKATKAKVATKKAAAATETAE